jgi:hypothetical protein
MFAKIYKNIQNQRTCNIQAVYLCFTIYFLYLISKFALTFALENSNG